MKEQLLELYRKLGNGICRLSCGCQTCEWYVPHTRDRWKSPKIAGTRMAPHCIRLAIGSSIRMAYMEETERLENCDTYPRDMEGFKKSLVGPVGDAMNAIIASHSLDIKDKESRSDMWLCPKTQDQPKRYQNPADMQAIYRMLSELKEKL